VSDTSWSGASWEASTSLSAHWSAKLSMREAVTVALESLRRFSTMAMRSMMGTAQTSPIDNAETSWNASTNPTSESSSTRESVWATSDSSAS